MEEGLAQKQTVAEYWEGFGIPKGVTGYVYHTVPVALYAWLEHAGDFEEAVTAVIALGGDTDTVAAITGALCGATSGVQAIPKPWIEGLADWPRGKGYIKALAGALSERASDVSVRCSRPGILLRNLVFLMAVLIHGILRWFPGGLWLFGRGQSH